MFPFDFISSLLAGCSSLPFSANGSAVEVDPGSRKKRDQLRFTDNSHCIRSKVRSPLTSTCGCACFDVGTVRKRDLTHGLPSWVSPVTP